LKTYNDNTIKFKYIYNLTNINKI